MRIDMEDSTVTQPTQDLLYQMWQKSYTCVGIVIQSYLYRSEEDTRQAVQQGIPISLCKGAYKEPARVAYPLKRDVDSAYDRLAEIMIRESQRLGAPQISKDGRFPPLVALATHDVKRIHFACQLASSLGLPKQALEFQMLNGIRRDLQEKLAGEGYPVRVYVPYGVEWYPYFMRRLAERPANFWFILTNFLRR